MKLFARIAVVTIIITWFFIVIANYYLVHKPFTLENALAILSTFANVLIACAFYALAAALGRRVLRAFDFASPLEALVFQTGIGLGIISFAVFVLGLIGVLHRIVFWLILIGALILLRGDLKNAWRDLRAIRVPLETRFERLLAWFLAISFALAFTVALTPTRAWDAQTYHLLVGKIALAQGRITIPPNVIGLSFPAFVEMLFLGAMALKDDGATALIHLGYGGLCVGALLAFAQRFLSARIGWIAAAFLFAVPSFMLVSMWPYNDAALAFYAFIGWYALVSAKEKSLSRWGVLAGVFAGMTLGMKYTAIFIPIALTVVFILDRNRLPWTAWIGMGVACAVVAFPWYLRTWVFMGNPVYPFFFGGRYWDGVRNNLFAFTGSGLKNDPIRLFLAPWEATILGQEGKALYQATIGALLLALMPVWLFVWRADDRSDQAFVLRNGVAFAVTLFAFWILGIASSSGLMQTRYLFPAFPVLALLAAIAFDRLRALDLPRFSLSAFARLVIIFVLMMTLQAQAMDWISLNPLAYLSGNESREQFIATRVPPSGYWDALQFLDKLDSAQILFLWEPRGYYASSSINIQPDEDLDLFVYWNHRYPDDDEMARALVSQGYQYILLCRWGLDFQLGEGIVTTDEAHRIEEFFKRHAHQIYGTHPLTLIEEAGQLRVRDADRAPYAIYALEP